MMREGWWSFWIHWRSGLNYIRGKRRGGETIGNEDGELEKTKHIDICKQESLSDGLTQITNSPHERPVLCWVSDMVN